jgi:hypothetical protein
MSTLSIHTASTTRGALAAPTGNYDSYIEVLLKLVPIEVLGAYLTIQGIVGSKTNPASMGLPPDKTTGIALFVSAGLLFIATPFVMMKLRGITDKWHIILGTLGFPVWLFATATTLFTYFPGDWWMSHEREQTASIVLVLFAFLVPFLYKPATLLPE